jgi:hypothetical protein
MADQPSLSFKKGLSFVVVMLAVVTVVGFVQVSVDQADERTALQMILADLETDSVEMTGVRNRGRSTDERVLWILQNLDAPQDSVRPRIINLFYYFSYQQARAGYENLLNAGRLTVISNPELRQRLVRYYELTHPYVWEFYDMYMNTYEEFKVTTAPFIGFGADPEGETYRTSYRVEWVRPWSEMKSDADFRFQLAEMGGVGAQFSYRMDGVLARNGELRAAIQAELGL